MAANPTIAPTPQSNTSRWIWIAVILLTLIGLAAATRRAVVLIHPTPTPQNPTAKNPAAQLDTGFLQHDLRTFAHIVPAAIYLLLLPFQFVRRIRARHPRF